MSGLDFINVNWLDEVTATGPSDVVQLEGAFRFGIAGNVTGGPSAAEVRLQVSIDGVSWKDAIVYGAVSGENVWQQSGLAVPIRFVRLNLTELTGGSSPAVSITVIGVQVVTAIGTNWE